MTDPKKLTPSAELVKTNRAHYPNESAEYRQARNALLFEEIELRRHLERVAELRRKLPLGGKVTGDYTFIGEKGPVRLADLFGQHQSLIVYSYMYGPQREQPCAMCTSLMNALELKVADFQQRVGLAMVARSPIDKLIAGKKERGWKNLPIFSDSEGKYTRDYVSAEDADIPGYNVFTKKNGEIYHFWSGEIGGEMADPGQDPRGAPDLDPLWNFLDTTPEGRGTDWYPKLKY